MSKLNVDVYSVCYDLAYRVRETYDTVLRSALRKNNNEPIPCTFNDRFYSRIEGNEIVEVRWESVIFEQNTVKVRALKRFSDGETMECAYPTHMLSLVEILSVMGDME